MFYQQHDRQRSVCIIWCIGCFTMGSSVDNSDGRRFQAGAAGGVRFSQEVWKPWRKSTSFSAYSNWNMRVLSLDGCSTIFGSFKLYVSLSLCFLHFSAVNGDGPQTEVLAEQKLTKILECGVMYDYIVASLGRWLRVERVSLASATVEIFPTVSIHKNGA